MALQFVTVFLGLLTIAGCSEIRDGEGACEAVTASSPTWFAAVLWPSALFAASQLVPWARSHSVAAAVAAVLLAAAFWTYVLMVD